MACVSVRVGLQKHMVSQICPIGHSVPILGLNNITTLVFSTSNSSTCVCVCVCVCVFFPPKQRQNYVKMSIALVLGC